ncbi:MAG TPA: galactokinase family protein [Acidobacteriaceae bacterium]|nr:galactokinase family protein [Acidobacteriaceae bacterium]
MKERSANIAVRARLTDAVPGASLSAPARVNLLGEQTDYTDGLVMPVAIPFYTQAFINARRAPRS